jgi:ferritin-like metal-binding protein YciE
MKTLHDLFTAQLSDIYDAERRLIDALPKVAEAATFRELRDVFLSHRDETVIHAKKVEAVFALLKEQPDGRKCHAIAGLLKEVDQIIAENKDSPTINAALISACQKIEHYETASYGCLREWAHEMGLIAAVGVLDEILGQEKTANRKLNDLARKGCNRAADDEQADGEPETITSKTTLSRGDRWQRPIY